MVYFPTNAINIVSRQPIFFGACNSTYLLIDFFLPTPTTVQQIEIKEM